MFWSNFFWLFISLILLIYLNRWITAHIVGIGFLISNNKAVAVWFYFFFFLPGILIHEVSHYIVATFLNVNVGKFSLWPKIKGQGEMVLGSVEVKGVGPIRHTLVGAAPIFFGCLAIWFIGRLLQFDTLTTVIKQGNFEYLLDALAQSLTTPDFWLWFYLLFVIANAMIPSRSDRIYWVPVFLIVSLIALVSIGLNIMPAIPDIVQVPIFNFLSTMVSALTFAVIVDLIFIAFIILLENLLMLTTRRRMVY